MMTQIYFKYMTEVQLYMQTSMVMCQGGHRTE